MVIFFFFFFFFWGGGGGGGGFHSGTVATDLGSVAALLHVIKHVERMGNQCVNVKLIPLSGREQAGAAGGPGPRPAHGASGALRRSSRPAAFQTRDTDLATDLAARTARSTASTARSSAWPSRSQQPDAREDGPCTPSGGGEGARRGLADNAVDIGEQTMFVSGLFHEFPTVPAGGTPAG